MLARTLIAFVRFYQIFVSPVLPGSCRFYPTCSSYSLESIRKYGALKGLVLTLFRILRCHPWHPGGHDPVR